LRLLHCIGFAAALALACGGEPIEPLPADARDTTGPSLSVLSPRGGIYDEDGDGLVDVRIVLADSGGLVDPAGIRVRSLAGVVDPTGQLTDTVELLNVWAVTERSESLLVVHETVSHLLPSRVNRIELTVPDSAGNITRDTVQFTLPYAAFHKTIKTGLTMSWLPAAGLALCPDDGRLYMTVVRRLVVFDPDSLALLTIIEPGFGTTAELGYPLCVPEDPLLYVTDYAVQRFDRANEQWVSEISNSYHGHSIVQSRRDPDLLYVGERNSGRIGIISRAAQMRLGGLLPFSPYDEFVFGLAVLDGDAKLYATRVFEEGILVVDPRRDTIPKDNPILDTIRIGGSSWPGYGVADAIVLSRDDRWLYAAVLDGDPRGIARIDTQLDSVVAHLPLTNYVPIDLALSPDESRMFVTTQDRFPDVPSQNVLIDMPGWRVLQRFPRPHPPGVTRFDRDIVFHPTGKTIFVTRDVDLDVYLNRR